MRQSIQEWTKWNLWKTAFKKIYLVHSWIVCPRLLAVFSILLWIFKNCVGRSSNVSLLTLRIFFCYSNQLQICESMMGTVKNNVENLIASPEYMVTKWTLPNCKLAIISNNNFWFKNIRYFIVKILRTT